jgi:hypothetical protein
MSLYRRKPATATTPTPTSSPVIDLSTNPTIVAQSRPTPPINDDEINFLDDIDYQPIHSTATNSTTQTTPPNITQNDAAVENNQYRQGQTLLTPNQLRDDAILAYHRQKKSNQRNTATPQSDSIIIYTHSCAQQWSYLISTISSPPLHRIPLPRQYETSTWHETEGPCQFDIQFSNRSIGLLLSADNYVPEYEQNRQKINKFSKMLFSMKFLFIIFNPNSKNNPNKSLILTDLNTVGMQYGLKLLHCADIFEAARYVEAITVLESVSGEGKVNLNLHDAILNPQKVAYSSAGQHRARLVKVFQSVPGISEVILDKLFSVYPSMNDVAKNLDRINTKVDGFGPTRSTQLKELFLCDFQDIRDHIDSKK